MKTIRQSFSLPLRLAAGVFALMFTSALFAQTEAPMPAMENLPKHSDSSFLKKAAKAGSEEINISNVAASRTTNPQIKELAQTIANAHEDVGTKLASLASTKGVALPGKELGAPKWEKRDGKNFDREYLKEMVDHHENAIELFSKAAKSNDVQIATFASEQLPMFQSHLSKAKELLRAIE